MSQHITSCNYLNIFSSVPCRRVGFSVDIIRTFDRESSPFDV